MKTLTKTTLLAFGAIVALGAISGSADARHHYRGYIVTPVVVTSDPVVAYYPSYGNYGYGYSHPIGTVLGGASYAIGDVIRSIF